MNSQMDHPKSHTTTYEYDDDPRRHDQNVGIEIGHNEEHHGEKKSVLKKVKAKAKKIKDSIKEHVGHGHDHDHDHDENDDEDDEMDMDPEIHGTNTAQHLMPGQEGAARRHTHTHEPQFGAAGEGARSKQSSYHTFDPTTATHTPGQEDTLGWSKTETGKLNEYDEQPFAPKNTPVGTLLGGGHSTGDLDMGKKGPPVKLGTVVGGSTGVEEDPQVPKDVGEDHHPATYQVRVIDPTGTGHDSKAGQGFMSGLHRTERDEMIQSPKSKFQGDFQTFDPSTTRYVPGHDETLDWSRTDTGRLHGSEELTNASTNTAIAAQAGHDSAAAHSFMPGLHRSEVDEKTGREGVIHSPRRKFQGDFQTFDPSTTSDIPGQEETLGWSRTDTGRQHRPEEPSHASKNIPIAGYDSTDAQSFMAGQHRSNLGERTEREEVPHSSKSKYLDDFHTFDHSTTSHVPGRLNGSEEPSSASKISPIAAHSGYDSTDTHMPQSFMPGQHRSILGERTTMEGALEDPEDKLQDDRMTFVHTTTSYVPGQEETLDWFRPDTGRLNESEELSNASKSTPVAAHSGYDPTAAQSFMPGNQRRSKLGEGTAMEGVTDATGSKLQGDYQTFVPSTTNYVPGQEETLDWSRTDTGRPNRFEELSNPSKNTPISTHTVRNHRMGADEERGTGKFGGLLENSGELLDKDPNTPRGLGERRRAGNYETKVGDPTGMGGEEVGVTPILHQFDKMNVHDEPHHHSRLGDAQLSRTEHNRQDENVFTGSHDQFFPESVSSEDSVFLQDTGPDSERSHEMPEQKQESYTEKISSAAAMVADKAKQATSSVTSKLGYGDNSDQHSADVSSGMHEKSSEPVGYGEKLSNVTTAITDKAVQAKNAVASTLGYGGNQEGQPHLNEGESRGEAPVYGNVATVALKMQDSGTKRDVHSPSTTGPSTEMDKGVSMKEYLAEKLRPGEEDKALSDVITEALPLHKRKEDVSRVGEEGKGDKVTIIGRVTESEEVARQFGRSEETNYDNAGTGMASPGKGVFDRLRDAATFWYQKGTEVPSQDDIAEGNEASPVISSMESEQKREQKREGGSGLQ